MLSMRLPKELIKSWMKLKMQESQIQQLQTNLAMTGHLMTPEAYIFYALVRSLMQDRVAPFNQIFIRVQRDVSIYTGLLMRSSS